jgi:hypothetical protein
LGEFFESKEELNEISELLKGLLAYNYLDRISAEQAKSMRYINNYETY